MKSALSWKDWIITVGILAISFLVSLVLQWALPSQSLVSIVFVLAVFLISLYTKGYLWGVAASIFSVLIVNYVFSFPFLAFDFISYENVIAASVMLCVAILTCTLTTKIKEHERIRAETATEKMRGNLLRAISHDLRTPLTTIYGACSAIIDNFDTLDKTQQLCLLEDIREDSESLIRMVENLLSVTRVNGGAAQIRKTDTVLEELVDTVLHKFQKQYPKHSVNVSIPEDFISIPMDALLIQQVLLNLLENAVIHAKGMTEISLRITTEKKLAIFEVADNGAGIPKELMGSLFTGQIYGKQTPSDSIRKGMGIGLSVCSTIIHAHGGTITAQNKPEGGALFRFYLEMEDLNGE